MFPRNLLCFLIVLLCLPAFSKAIAEDFEYWLNNGSTNVQSCEGASNPKLYKAGNDGHWYVLISAIVTCEERIAVYRFEIDFMNIKVNPPHREDWPRSRFKFDWAGLALYRRNNSNTNIEWLYDEAFPIDGVLDKNSEEIISFGNIIFDIPKSSLENATHMTFYVTISGTLEPFGLL